MQPLLAETAPQRARLAWFAAALASTTLAVALSRPVHTVHVNRHHHARGMHSAVGHCVEMSPMPSAQVHAFYVHY
jgi:hypothetical protein